MITYVTHSIFFLLIASSSLFAQSTSNEIDSLTNALEQFSEKETEYGMTLLALANKLVYQNPEQATRYAEEAAALGEKLADKKLLAEAVKLRGTCYLAADRFAEALRSYLDAIPLFEALGDGISLGNCYNNASLGYKHLGDYVQSLDYLVKAEHIYDSVGFTIGIARANNNMGSLFRIQRGLNQAESHYLKAYRIHTSHENASGIGSAQLNLGLLYNEMQEYDKS